MVRTLEAVFTTWTHLIPFLCQRNRGRRTSRGWRGTGHHRTTHSRGDDKSCLLPIAIGSALALETTLRPGHGREAFRADRQFALDAASKAAFVNPAQCGFHFAQQGGLAVHVSNRQIPFRRVLNLVHLVRALLDGDAVPVSQYLNQLGRFSVADFSEPTHLSTYSLHCRPLSFVDRKSTRLNSSH